MLKKYDNLKTSLGGLTLEIQNNKDKLRNHMETRNNFKKLIENKNKQREREIAEHIKNMEESYTDEVICKYDDYLEELSKYRSLINSEFLKINKYIDNYGFVDNSQYHNKISAMDEVVDDLKIYLEPVMTDDMLKMYKDQGYGHNLNNLTLNKLKKWLEYFNNYEVHDRVMGKALKAEKAIVGKIDTTIILVVLVVLGSILVQHKYLTIFPYLIFVILTLYLRTREFHILLMLFGIYGYTKDRLVDLEDSNSSELRRYAEYYSKMVGQEYLGYQELIVELEKEIKKDKEVSVQKALENFDLVEAKKRAESLIEIDTENTINLLEEEETHIEEFSKLIEDLNTELNNGKVELKRLKEDIREVYQNLTPSFKSLEMLESFFLGFKDDEPVRFIYSGEPALIFYNSKTGELDAVMTTIKMMCGQIMTTLNPLAYTINVVDTLTGGAPVSSFQVTKRDEDDMYTSKLFKVASTISENNNLIEHLFKEYNSRRVKVLGNYNSIREYNEDKVKINARTMPFEICYFYEYDYKILEEELMQQLTRVAHSIGFCLFFMVDMSKIEPPKKKDDKKDNIEEEKKGIFSYQADTLYKIFNLFDEKNIYGFSVREDDITILNVKKKDILKNIIKMNER